jgi:hypothetical protein
MKRFVDRVGIVDSVGSRIDRNPRWAAATLQRFSLCRGISKAGNRKG